jgi:hypothetical protein
VRAQHHDHRRRLREIVQHFEPDTNLHSKYFPDQCMPRQPQPVFIARLRGTAVAGAARACVKRERRPDQART